MFLFGFCFGKTVYYIKCKYNEKKIVFFSWLTIIFGIIVFFLAIKTLLHINQ